MSFADEVSIAAVSRKRAMTSSRNKQARFAFLTMAIDLSDKSEASLKRVMRDFGIDDRERAIAHIVQDWLVGHGYLATAAEGNEDDRSSAPDELDRETLQYPSYFKDGGSL